MPARFFRHQGLRGSAGLGLAVLGVWSAGLGSAWSLASFGLAAWLLDVGADAPPAVDSAPLDRRDRWPLAGLLLWALAVLLWRLDSAPPGPGFVESAMAVLSQDLATHPYTPHVAHFQAAFPSLVFYQGMAAAKLLGWNLASLRLPAALWGALSVPVLYLLLRQFSGRGVAAAFSLLFSVNNLFLTEARLFFPGSLLWFSELGAAVFLLQGLRRGGVWRFALAGACAGLSLHGYTPGRVVLPFLTAWLLGLAWIQPRGTRRPGSGPLLAFLGVALLCAAPVLFWALRHPAEYWAMPSHLRYASLGEALRSVGAVLPDYLRFFHSRADGVLEPTDGLARFPLLHADPLLALLLPLGLLACLRQWRRPVASLALLGLVAGLLPALLAHSSTHPTSRRLLLLLPWIYVAGAWTWEGLRRRGEALVGPWYGRGLAAATFLGLVLSLHQYHRLIMARPSVRSQYSVEAGDMDAERRAHPGAAVRASMDLVQPVNQLLVYVRDEENRQLAGYPNFAVLDANLGPLPVALKQFEDFLAPAPPGPRLFLLAPYLHTAAPLLQALFPGGEARLYAEARDFDAPMPPQDRCAPYVQLLSFSVPAADSAAYRGLVDLGREPYAAGGRLDPWDAGFGPARRGALLDLGGAWISAGGRARLFLAWPGWRLWLDQRPVGAGGVDLAPGAHRLRLRGRVPADARGGLPLRLSLEGADLDPAATLVPLDPRYGFAAELDAGARSLRRWELLPSHRWWPPEGLPGPATLRLRGRLRAPRDGQYRLHAADTARVTFLRPAVPAGADPVLDLRAGQAVALELSVPMGAQPQASETLFLLQRGPGEAEWSPLPYDWVLAP